MNAGGLTQRECGTCSACCRLLEIVELNKPADEWCRHCRPGRGGCTIYSARPAACAGFTCAWLQGDLPEHWFPEEVRMFVDMRDTGAGRVLCVYVDPHFPDRWREDPYCADIENIAAGGLDGALGFRFATHVIVGRRVISAVGSPL